MMVTSLYMYCHFIKLYSELLAFPIKKFFEYQYDLVKVCQQLKKYCNFFSRRWAFVLIFLFPHTQTQYSMRRNKAYGLEIAVFTADRRDDSRPFVLNVPRLCDIQCKHML